MDEEQAAAATTSAAPKASDPVRSRRRERWEGTMDIFRIPQWLQ
jgi:hypothetical protein